MENQKSPSTIKRIITVPQFVLYTSLTAGVTSFIVDKKRGDSNSEALIGALTSALITAAVSYGGSFLFSQSVEQ